MVKSTVSARRPQRQPNPASGLLAHPATATPPPNGHAPEALYAPAEGCLRLWVATHDEMYRIVFMGKGPEGRAWRLIKGRDGTRYDILEAPNGNAERDCPGFMRWGQTTLVAKGGCKHIRALRAIRRLLAQA